ncbi:hypothetical protein D3C76_1376130 [compost metagenome]
MDKPRNRAGSAIADVSGRSSDRACRSKTTEQRRDQVSDALADQLLIGVVLGSLRPVSDYRR